MLETLGLLLPSLLWAPEWTVKLTLQKYPRKFSRILDPVVECNFYARKKEKDVNVIYFSSKFKLKYRVSSIEMFLNFPGFWIQESNAIVMQTRIKLSIDARKNDAKMKQQKISMDIQEKKIDRQREKEKGRKRNRSNIFGFKGTNLYYRSMYILYFIYG